MIFSPFNVVFSIDAMVRLFFIMRIPLTQRGYHVMVRRKCTGEAPHPAGNATVLVAKQVSR